MASLLLVIVSILVISVSDCYPYGAPACVSAPRHGLEPQQGDPDIKVSKEQSEAGDWEVQLGAEGAEVTFRGFMLLTTAPGERIQRMVEEKIA